MSLKEQSIEGEGYTMSFGEAGTLGKTITEGGRRFAKTYDPTKQEYKSIQESGWGEKMKVDETLEDEDDFEVSAGAFEEQTGAGRRLMRLRSSSGGEDEIA